MDDASLGRSALELALRRYLDARSTALQVARAALGIRELDARALLFIAENPGTRPTLLRDYLGITSPGVTTLVDRLVDRGVVRRDVDETDRRINRLTVTVDLGVEPWSALSRFDSDFSVAIGSRPRRSTDEFARLLDELTESVGGP